MTSIRGKLLLAFTALALAAVGGMALGGWEVLRARAVAQARAAFARAHTTLERSLEERYAVFTQIANLSYIDPVIRAVAGGATDEADFGLGAPEDDRRKLEKLHANLVDANWDWSAAAGEGSFAVADYKGRVLYASATPSWGGDAGVLPAVAEALGDDVDHIGSMVVSADDARVRALGLARPGTTGVLLVMARAEVLRGKPQAVFLEIIGARKLMGEVAATEGTQVTLVTDGGATDGTVPAHAVAAAGADPVTVDAAGSTWLVQSYALPGPGSARRIGTIVVGQDLGAELAELIDPAVVPLTVIAAGLLLAALAAAIVLAARFTRPIVALEAAAQRVAAGDLGVRVAIRPVGGDEIARLGRTFEVMVDGLRERERIKSTFKKYLDPDVVDYLLAHPEAQELGGVRRELTVVFSDIVRFTALAEARAPEEVVAILNRYFTQVSERIAARGGTVDKYIGDAVMSFFGAPVPRPDHAARACLAALDHLTVVDALARAGAGPRLEVRIGINTGEMILGNIGGGGQQDYTVIGDAVNLAQRVEGVNRDYGTRLLVTEAAAHAAGAAVETREIDSLVVPGRAAPVTVHEVLGEAGWSAAHPERARGVGAYADGLRWLRERRFSDAAAAFRSALGHWPEDGPAHTLYERAEAFTVAPPPSDWDGSFRKLTK